MKLNPKCPRDGVRGPFLSPFEFSYAPLRGGEICVFSSCWLLRLIEICGQNRGILCSRQIQETRLYFQNRIFCAVKKLSPLLLTQQRIYNTCLFVTDRLNDMYNHFPWLACQTNLQSAKLYHLLRESRIIKMWH